MLLVRGPQSAEPGARIGTKSFRLRVKRWRPSAGSFLGVRREWASEGPDASQTDGENSSSVTWSHSSRGDTGFIVTLCNPLVHAAAWR